MTERFRFTLYSERGSVIRVTEIGWQRYGLAAYGKNYLNMLLILNKYQKISTLVIHHVPSVNVKGEFFVH